MTKMLPPTTLEGPAAPLPYQLELAAITAAIDRMKQCDAKNPINPNNLPYVISDTQPVELSATLTKLEKNRPVSPQQAEVSPPETAPMPIAAMADRLPDNGNRPEQCQADGRTVPSCGTTPTKCHGTIQSDTHCNPSTLQLSHPVSKTN